MIRASIRRRDAVLTACVELLAEGVAIALFVATGLALIALLVLP
jgi:hypothetical protein